MLVSGVQECDSGIHPYTEKNFRLFSIIGLLQDAENSSVLYSRFLLFIYLICGNVYLLILNSQIMPPSPCPFDNHNLFSISESVYFIKQT